MKQKVDKTLERFGGRYARVYENEDSNSLMEVEFEHLVRHGYWFCSVISASPKTLRRLEAEGQPRLMLIHQSLLFDLMLSPLEEMVIQQEIDKKKDKNKSLKICRAKTTKT